MRWLHLVLPPAYLALLLSGCLADSIRFDDPPAMQAAAPAAPLFCYRNLARVDCYTAPDPQRRR